MSTQPTATLNPTIAAITIDSLTYVPAVIAGIQAAEATGQPGATKQQAVINGILGSVEGATGVLATTPGVNANVSAIAALINLFVSIFYPHKAATTATE